MRCDTMRCDGEEVYEAENKLFLQHQQRTESEFLPPKKEKLLRMKSGRKGIEENEKFFPRRLWTIVSTRFIFSTRAKRYDYYVRLIIHIHKSLSSADVLPFPTLCETFSLLFVLERPTIKLIFEEKFTSMSDPFCKKAKPIKVLSLSLPFSLLHSLSHINSSEKVQNR